MINKSKALKLISLLILIFGIIFWWVNDGKDILYGGIQPDNYFFIIVYLLPAIFFASIPYQLSKRYSETICPQAYTQRPGDNTPHRNIIWAWIMAILTVIFELYNFLIGLSYFLSPGSYSGEFPLVLITIMMAIFFAIFFLLPLVLLSRGNRKFIRFTFFFFLIGTLATLILDILTKH